MGCLKHMQSYRSRCVCFSRIFFKKVVLYASLLGPHLWESRILRPVHSVAITLSRIWNPTHKCFSAGGDVRSCPERSRGGMVAAGLCIPMPEKSYVTPPILTDHKKGHMTAGETMKSHPNKQRKSLELQISGGMRRKQ